MGPSDNLTNPTIRGATSGLCGSEAGGAPLGGTQGRCGLGPRLQRALALWFLDNATLRNGYTEIAPPYLVRPEVQGVIPRAFSDARNPLQMVNPWAPPRYGTWVESTVFEPGIPTNRPLNEFDPNTPGKWRGIKLFEILF